MKLYRYMAFDHDILRDTDDYDILHDTVVGNGFAAQYASCFDDAFEGVAGVKIDGVQSPMQLASSALVQHYSILCFNKPDETEPNHEMRMWSLYANKNYGVRIVLDLPWSDLCATSYAVMGNVRYDDIIPVIQVKSRSVDEILNGRKSIFEQAETISSMFFVKHTRWQWEKEYRVVIENEISNDISMTKIKKDQPARYCAKFLKSYIKGIDFGLNLWRDEETKVRQFIDAMRKERSDLIFRKPVCLSDRKPFSFEVID